MRIKCWYEGGGVLANIYTQPEFKTNCSPALWELISKRRRTWMRRRAWIRYKRELKARLRKARETIVEWERHVQSQNADIQRMTVTTKGGLMVNIRCAAITKQGEQDGDKAKADAGDVATGVSPPGAEGRLDTDKRLNGYQISHRQGG